MSSRWLNSKIISARNLLRDRKWGLTLFLCSVTKTSTALVISFIVLCWGGDILFCCSHLHLHPCPHYTKYESNPGSSILGGGMFFLQWLAFVFGYNLEFCSSIKSIFYLNVSPIYGIGGFEQQ